MASIDTNVKTNNLRETKEALSKIIPARFAEKGPAVISTRCAQDCGVNGECVEGVCQCADGFTGTGCSQATCLSSCAILGDCQDGKCLCSTGVEHPDCISISIGVEEEKEEEIDCALCSSPLHMKEDAVNVHTTDLAPSTGGLLCFTGMAFSLSYMYI
jgi:hypothetical protein